MKKFCAMSTNWKELLQYLIENPQEIRNMLCVTGVFDEICFCDGYSITRYINNQKVTIEYKSGLVEDTVLNDMEDAEYTLLFVKLKQVFSEYHIDQINQLINTPKPKITKTIEELNDDDE